MDIQTLTKFLMWCTIINGGLLIFSTIFCVFIQDFVYRMHSKWFPMPRESFNVILYSFIGVYKIIFIAFNLVPYLALLIAG